MLIIAFWIRPKPLLGVLLPLLKYNTKPKSVSTTIYLRSTPAYAGKTLGKKTGQSACRDHPRLRGKDDKSTVAPEALTGSPPLARERPSSSRIAYSGDHPRLRGKDQSIIGWINRFPGSPPLARERLVAYGLDPQLIRITPACAGKTLQRSWKMLHD